jgi:hypothetical protein
MVCQELETIKMKLTTLYGVLSKLVPIKNMKMHPFEIYSRKLERVTHLIDTLIEEAKKEVEEVNAQNMDLFNTLKDYESRLEMAVRVELPAFDNLFLVGEWLHNEIGRLKFEEKKVECETKTISDEIQEIESWIGLVGTPLNETESVCGDVVSLKKLNKLRDVLNTYKGLKEVKEKERNRMVKEIRKCYTMLGIKEYDEIGEAILHKPDEVKIVDVEEKYKWIKALVEKRKGEVKELLEAIDDIRELLGGSVKKEHALQTEITDENIKLLESHLKELREEESRLFDEIFEKTHQELDEICRIFGLRVGEYGRTRNDLNAMRMRINTMMPKKVLYLKCRFNIERRETLIGKMIEFEKVASDPKRLFKSSFQLLSEEKFRKNAVPNLLKIEDELLREINKYEEEFGAFIYQENLYKSFLEKEIKDRIVNKTVFISNKGETPRKGRK